MQERVSYKKCKSSASCSLDGIKGIIFGGQTSRFWVLRKHINTISRDQLHKLPFYSWDCITLQLENRDVDLVIKSEEQMTMFIKFMVYTLRTINGERGTANKILDTLLHT
jgi:hypothetical protein